MRTIITIILLFFLAIGMKAQNADVSKIRKLYSDAKTIIEKGDPELPPEMSVNKTTVTSRYMAPGSGIINDVINYYYFLPDDDETDNPSYRLYFITRNSNDGYYDYCEEFLFDNNSLVFYYCKRTEQQGERKSSVTRYYYQPEKGLIHTIASDGPIMDDVFAMRLADDLKEAFNKLLNRDY